jgi:hypothetical protein
MGRNAGFALLILLACSELAHAGGKHENWKAVERLGHGVPVEVQLQGEAGTDSCLVVSADNNALTCVRDKDPDVDWDAASGARLVFPRSAVQNVWFLTTSSRHIVAWIVAAVTIALVIAECADGNVVAGLFLGGIVAAVAGVRSEDAMRFPRPRQLQLRRLLIYRAATP